VGCSGIPGARSFNSQNIGLTNFGNFIEDQTNIFEGCNNFFRVSARYHILNLYSEFYPLRYCNERC
jgi:hypothetical protein